MDEFDHWLRRGIIVAFVLGSLAHLLVAHLWPGRAAGNTILSDVMVLIGLLSAVAIARLPWRRYGRDLFAFILLYAALLIAGLIYSTGGPDSPFGVAFLLIAVSAGLYHPTRIALLVAIACTFLGFLPLLYATPGRDFVVRQLVLSASVAGIFWFQRRMLPELLRRARAEQHLQDDLRETRRLRDELARANALLARQARTDALTGLPNHGVIIARADEELARAAGAGTPVSLLFVDLDYFKEINDTHGHQTGDRVLEIVSRRAAGTLRPGDTIGRYGGEEFLIVLPGAGPAAATRIAERLRGELRDHPIALPEGPSLAVTVSIGAATCRGGACTRQDLLRAADTALYAAKRAGRDRLCVAPPCGCGDGESGEGDDAASVAD